MSKCPDKNETLKLIQPNGTRTGTHAQPTPLKSINNHIVDADFELQQISISNGCRQ